MSTKHTCKYSCYKCVGSITNIIIRNGEICYSVLINKQREINKLKQENIISIAAIFSNKTNTCNLNIGDNVLVELSISTNTNRYWNNTNIIKKI
jgi:hypothetical protein